MAQTPITLPYTGGGVPAELRPILCAHEGAAEREAQERILMARAYHAGRHDVRLTDRLRQFLGSDCDQFALRLNMTAKVTKAIAERLVVESWGTSATGTKAAVGAQVSFANAVWQGSRMKAKRSGLMVDIVCDGEMFILIDFDNESNRPRLTPHRRYTDPSITAGGLPGCSEVRTNRDGTTRTVITTPPSSAHKGTGEGMWMCYPNGDLNQRPLYAVKRWVEHGTDENGRAWNQERCNVYYDDRLEKWGNGSQGWRPLPEEDETWPVPFLDAAGKPLGIPCVHVRTPEMLPATMEAIPLQKALNKTLVDLLASSDSSAFRILIALGWKPFDGDGNALAIAPGQWIGALGSQGGQFPPSVEVVEGADLGNQISVLDKITASMADAVDVPLSLINRSAQRAAEGTLQEEKESFAAKIRDYQDTVEQAFEDALKIARRLANTFGVASESQAAYGYGQLDEGPEFELAWAPFSPRSVADQRAEAEALIAAGIPQQEIWQRVWGYTPEQVAELQRMAFAGDGYPDMGGAAVALDEDGGPVAGVVTTQALNGAQMSSAQEVIVGISSGLIPESVGAKLLVAVGFVVEDAEQMAAEAAANRLPAPPAASTEGDGFPAVS